MDELETTRSQTTNSAKDTTCYFGYGSNINHRSLQSKGVAIGHSETVTLKGWRLRFNVQYFFKIEGGMANIEATGDPNDYVVGTLHWLDSKSLAALDAVEAYGYGYDRIPVVLHRNDGTEIQAITYIGMPEFIDNHCKPSRRYLNIICAGAKAAALPQTYIDWLASHEILPLQHYPDFEIPKQPAQSFNQQLLSQHPLLTSLYGCVFDMSNARPLHNYLKIFFGGKDMTVFHLKRLDCSDGNETIEDVRNNRLTLTQHHYLNAYLHEYAKEYRFVGRIQYD